MPDTPPANNPFRPPSLEVEKAAAESTPLTRWQRNALETYVRYRDEPIRLSLLMLQMVPAIIAVTLLIGLPAFAIAWFAEFETMIRTILTAGFGFFFGYFLCVYSINHRFVQFWPTLRRCIDWKQLELVLAPSTPTKQEPLEAILQDDI